ncbi:CRISPR-associated endoribonuclease Cas6 [Thermoanaerobacterium sp. RBIITD]|uniref:CRISPR-associated endoribonuclease Cas6 n=1 Tax=Thermoanaerobacterium sp. RBIITD TaxID=1550240 RepID=UPI000BB842E7|nr:CRISPR-associated endoribonuclease Cas6 [Thermoanaerobacterium sp. RBIITD]SNX53170.1 CRISPR-associated endoribonuclease Cas6 [Thermoanaerobacterium sp. RBIITD]
MRIKLTLLPEKDKSLNLNYNYFISSWIYHILKNSNLEYAEKLHEEGYKYGSKIFKLFTFSQLRCKNVQVDRENIKFMDNTYLFISSPKAEFLVNFVKQLVNESYLIIQDYKFEIKLVETLKEPDFKEVNKFICLSPVISSTAKMKNGKKVPWNLSINDEAFVDNIKSNIIEKYFVLNNTLPDNLSINIEFDQEYISKHPKGKLINFKNIPVKGYMAPFIMSGNKELIKVAYNCGIGEKNSAGFGMIEIINA